jgi:hypothetical protein
MGTGHAENRQRATGPETLATLVYQMPLRLA